MARCRPGGRSADSEAVFDVVGLRWHVYVFELELLDMHLEDRKEKTALEKVSALSILHFGDHPFSMQENCPSLRDEFVV